MNVNEDDAFLNAPTEDLELDLTSRNKATASIKKEKRGRESVSVFVPGSVANLAVGFDILGAALTHVGERVTLSRIDGPRGLRMGRVPEGIPTEVHKNTAGVSALKAIEALGLEDESLELSIEKQIAPGSGLGSSASSAVAGAYAVHVLSGFPFSEKEVLEFAAHGEAIASGGIHLDNVAPSLMGGLVLIRDTESFDVCRIPFPTSWCFALVRPDLELSTKHARSILRPEVPFVDVVRQTANLGGFLFGVMHQDMELVSRSLCDVLVEHQRKQLIPGFEALKSAAIDAGAMGASISGAGPTVFALCDSHARAENVKEAMCQALLANQIRSTGYVSNVSLKGASVLAEVE